jgi:RHS repeat-associated protein
MLSRRPLFALVLAAFLLIVILMTSSQPALALPPSCKPNPGGTQECTSPLVTPYLYTGARCNASSGLFASEQAALAHHEVEFPPMCPAQRLGWIPINAPRCINGVCGLGTEPVSVACGGLPYSAPWTGDGGHEVLNWLVFKVTHQMTESGCQPRDPFDSGAVRRERGLICPQGYVREGSTCVRNGIDPPKNFGAPCPACGNPISPGTGNKFQRETDYAGTGEFPLVFERYYNSQMRVGDNENSYFSSFQYQSVAGLDGWRGLAVRQGRPAIENTGQARRDGLRWMGQGIDAIGANWRHTYQRSIYYSESTEDAVSTAFVFRHDGRVFPFTRLGDSFYPQGDISDRLTGSPATGWTYTSAANDEVETYDADGFLRSIRSRGGLTHTLAYDVDGRLTTVSDDFGRALTFSYGAAAGEENAEYQITGMTDPAGGTYVFGYGSGSTLTSVTYPGSAVRQYVYGGSTARALTGIVDESGATFATFAYNQHGEATLSTHAGNAGHVSISYTKAGITNVGPATVTDALGMARVYQFTNVLGVAKLTSITQPAATTGGMVSQTFSYDVNGNIQSKVDFRGVRTCYTYDMSRNLELSRTEGLSGSSCPGTLVAGVTRTTTTAWHATFRLPTQIGVYAGGSASGTPLRQTTFTHDASGNVLTRTVTDFSVSPNVSRTWTNTYDSSGRILTQNGPRSDVNDTTTYTYYNCTSGFQCGRLHTVTNAVGHVTTYNTYDAHGAPLTITDANGVVTTLAYDLRQRLTSRTVEGEIVGFTYWPTGLLKRVTQPDGSYLEYGYDNAHRLTQVSDDEGNRISYTLDAMGNRTAESAYDPGSVLSRTQTQVFNTLNQLRKQIGAAGTPSVTTTFTHDNNGNQTAINAPMDRSTVNQYDALNRLKQTIDPAVGSTVFAYDAVDNLTSVVNPRGLTTSYTYNGFDEVVTLVSPDTGTTASTFDAAGNLQTKTDARGITGTHAYDALNRLTSISYPDQVVSFTYDSGANAMGRLSGASDANHSMTWSYDSHGRVVGKNQTVASVTRSVVYGYANGNLASIATPSGQTITYGYTGGRISSVAVNGTTVLNGVLYEPFGPVRQWVWGNGMYAVRTLDQDGRVAQIDSGGDFYEYTYDDASRITDITNASDGNLTWNYQYDKLDRVSGAASALRSAAWTYDANGNRLTEAGDSLGQSFDTTNTVPATSNRLASISGSRSNTYGYDNAGNITSETDAGRPVSIGATSVVSYLYNAQSERIWKSGPGSPTYFFYDEAGHLLGEYGSGGILIQETVWMGDVPVATLRPRSGGGVDIFYVHTDHLNTPRKVSRPNDDVLVWRWDPAPFGDTVPDENPQGAGTFRYNLRFPGQYYDGESGLNYNYFRDYDPATGRYVESDPIGLDGGINTYAYGLGDPISEIDSLGLRSRGHTAPSPSLFPPGPFDAPWNESVNHAALKMEEAVAKAAAALRAICDPECRELEKKISALASELRLRYLAALYDRKYLYNRARTEPLSGRSGSWIGHKQQFEEKQRSLRALIVQADAKKCIVKPDDRALSMAPFPNTPADR